MQKNYWLPVAISLFLLFSINILMVSSLAPNLLLKQLLAWFIGFLLFLFGKQLIPKQLSPLKYVILIFSCVLLIFPILLNNITRGSRRWIDIGPVSIQPTEISKPLLMIFLSTTTIPLLHLIPVSIIALQPDLGSAISMLFLMAPIVLYNSKLLKLAIIAAIGLAAISPLIWQNFLQDYQKNRITYFLNPASDPLGKGYNVIQSKIAIGSGGFFGKGYKKGSQGQLLFLPEKHTDFMFAATAEELGFFGISLIIFSYYLLIGSLLKKAYNTTDRVLFIFTLGIAFQIWMQAFVNIGMNIGLLPVTGIPLPFLSVGGSSIMALLFSIGIVFSS